MIQNNRNEAIQEWLSASPFVTDLYFNFSPAEPNVTSVAPVSGERVLRHYIDGSALMCYEFGVIQYKPVNMDVPNNTDNAEAMYDVELFMDWVKEQNALRNFPRFDGCVMQRADVLNNLPMAAGTDNEVAKYMYMCRLTYEGKEN